MSFLITYDYYINIFNANNKKKFISDYIFSPIPLYHLKKTIFFDKNLFLFGSNKDIIRLYDIKEKKKIFDFYTIEKPIDSFQWNKKNSLFISSEYSIYQWNRLKNDLWKKRLEIKCEKCFDFLIFLKNQKTMISCTSNQNKLFVWNVCEEKTSFVGKTSISDKISFIKPCRKSNKFAISTKNHKIFILDENGTLIYSFYKNKFCDQFQWPGEIVLDWVSSNTIVFGGSGNDIFGLDLRQRKQSFLLSGHESEISCLASGKTPNEVNSNNIISSDKNGTLKLWDTRMSREVITLNNKKKKITSIESFC